MELAKNQEHTVTIEGYGEGGMGVARIDGRVVFVYGALRGEKCRVLILKTLKSVAFAKVLEVIEPSSERITPQQFSGTVSAAIHSLVSRQTASI